MPKQKIKTPPKWAVFILKKAPKQYMLEDKGSNMSLPDIRLYCSKRSKKYSEKDIQKIKFVSDSTIAEVNLPTVVVDHKTTAYAIFDNNKKLVPQSLQYRGKKHQFIPKKIPQNLPYIDTEVIFVGRIYPHFGHFLIEHLNRLWVKQKRHSKVKFLFINNLNIPVQNFVYDFMYAYGAKKEDIIILNDSARFKKIYIPNQTLNISSAWISKKMPIGYRTMANNLGGLGYDKIYMSRTKLPSHMCTIGEEKIQKIFEKNGFKIIYPETMTIAEQISAVTDARYLAGCAGTALHWALCMKPGGTVISLKRNSIEDNFTRTQYMINNVSGLKSVFIWSSIEKHKSKHGGQHAPQIIGVNQYLKQFFDDFGFKYDAKDIEFDQSAMNQYLEQYNQYEQEHGGILRNYLVRHFIKIIVCFVPGRINRKRVRSWLKQKLHI